MLVAGSCSTRCVGSIGVQGQGDHFAGGHDGHGDQVAALIGVGVDDQPDCLLDLGQAHASICSSVTRTRAATSSASSEAPSRPSLSEASVWMASASRPLRVAVGTTTT